MSSVTLSPSKRRVECRPSVRTPWIVERRRLMIDAVIKFVKKHPKATADGHVKGLDGGKNGLSFPDYALIVPYWNGGDIVLRLLKSGEDWLNNLTSDESES